MMSCSVFPKAADDPYAVDLEKKDALIYDVQKREKTDASFTCCFRGQTEDVP